MTGTRPAPEADFDSQKACEHREMRVWAEKRVEPIADSSFTSGGMPKKTTRRYVRMVMIDLVLVIAVIGCGAALVWMVYAV